MQGKHMGHTNTGKGRVQGKPLVCCTAGRPGQRAGWNLLRACESREQGRDGRDTPRGRRRGEDGMPRWSCVAPTLLMSMRGPPEVMLPGRAFHVARVARAPTPCQCAHVATWKAPRKRSTQIIIIYYSWNGSRAEAVCAGEKRVRMR